jgi:hypothetical protein
MTLQLELFEAQKARWPHSGRHILAHFDDRTIVVYQAFKPSIAAYAIEHGRFGGPDYRFRRMTWLKTSFLWMMYRSAWGTRPNQETTLAVRMLRSGFDWLLAEAVSSTYVEQLYPRREMWQSAIATSDVRLQWDPDHDPRGAACERRAIQLGIRDRALDRYVREWIVAIEDVSALVAEQRNAALAGAKTLLMPRETVYPVADPATVKRLRLTESEDAGSA